MQTTAGSQAWHGNISLILPCVFRIFHNKGKETTLVCTKQPEQQAIFFPGDPSLLFCLSTAGARLVNLRGQAECSAFCKAVDKEYCRLATASGECKGSSRRDA